MVARERQQCRLQGALLNDLPRLQPDAEECDVEALPAVQCAAGDEDDEADLPQAGLGETQGEPVGEADAGEVGVMKIRFRRNGEPIERTVLEESPSYYLAQNAPGLLPLVCEKASWEEVKPEPIWEDVTGECEVHRTSDWKASLVHHVDKRFIDPLNSSGYRVRKVFKSEAPEGCAVHRDTPHCFIIERIKS